MHLKKTNLSPFQETRANTPAGEGERDDPVEDQETGLKEGGISQESKLRRKTA